MPVYWSQTKLGVQKPGGIFWRMVQHPWINIPFPGKLSAQFNGFVADYGVITAVQKLVTASFTGVMQPAGVLAPALKQLTASLNAAQSQIGSIATQLPQPLAASFNAQEIEQGTINVSFPGALSAQLSGAQTDSGVIGAAIAQLAAALNATEQPQGVINASLALATAAITGGQIQSGAVAVSLQKALASFTAAEIESGTIGVSLLLAVAQLAGTSVAAAQPQFDAQTATPFVSSSASTGSVTLTIGVNATVYVAFASGGSSRTVSSVTATSGVTALVGSVNLNNSASSGTLWVYKVTGAAAGSVTVTVTLSSTTRLSITAFSFTAVNNEMVVSTQFASAHSMTIGPATFRASAVAVALYAAYLSSASGTITGSGGTALPTAQQSANDSGVAAQYSATSGTTFTFTDSSTTNGPLGGILLTLDAVAAPVPTPYPTPGTYTQTVPASGRVDLIAMGGGGGGSGGGSNNGLAGAAGQWGIASGLVIGTDIQPGSTITITVGAGGTNAPSNSNGGNGGNTTIQYVDMTGTTHTVTGLGGAGGVGQDGTGAVPGGTPSPKTQVLDDVKYTAGAGGTGSSSPSADGTPPGGGGGGLTAFSGSSGKGAAGEAWVTIS